MWGNLHVRVYPQPSGPAYRLSFLYPLLSISFLFLYVLCTDRKRAPLPPQATTFLTSSSTAPEYARDAPLQSSAAPLAPRSLRDFSGYDSNVPLGPRSMTHVNEESLPRNAPTGGTEYDRDRGRNALRQSNHYPAPLSSANASVNVDDEEGRMDRYSKVIIFSPYSNKLVFHKFKQSRGRTADYMKAPPQPSSGTNNIPIGNKRSPYNPDARPPPSTLIDPVKVRELLPPGKESYERVRIFRSKFSQCSW